MRAELEHVDAMVVGAGPSGMAAALMLEKRGWKSITVVERAQTVDYFDKERAFMYCIDARGQQLLKLVGLDQELPSRAVPTSEFKLSYVTPKSGVQDPVNIPIKDDAQTTYWLPRHRFVQLLSLGLEGSKATRILCGTAVTDISEDSEEGLVVTIESNDGETRRLRPRLLLGCDGLNSKVRAAMDEWTQGGFTMHKLPSGSSELRYKVLSLPPGFALDHSGAKAKTEQGYILTSAFTQKNLSMRLGVLPLRDPTGTIERTANMITSPDHEVWSRARNAEELYQLFEVAFPQIPWRETLPVEEAERFAKSKGGRFPTPQHPHRLHLLLPDDSKTGGKQSDDASRQGILLIGDSCHCFPPDIGQGVNAALQDVCTLHDTMERCEDEIIETLTQYEKMRMPDVRSLVKLVQTSYPWQYSQNELAKFLWTLNFILRTALNKLIPSVFSPHSFLLVQQSSMSYSSILRLANQTTQRIVGICSILLCAVVVMSARASGAL